MSSSIEVQNVFLTDSALFMFQALAGEVGMSSELDDVAKSLYNGLIPGIWRRLAPATLKSLGNWMLHFLSRYKQYNYWVCHCVCLENSARSSSQKASQTLVLQQMDLSSLYSVGRVLDGLKAKPTELSQRLE